MSVLCLLFRSRSRGRALATGDAVAGAGDTTTGVSATAAVSALVFVASHLTLDASPLSAAVSVYVPLVAPAIATPLRNHWYVNPVGVFVHSPVTTHQRFAFAQRLVFLIVKLYLLSNAFAFEARPAKRVARADRHDIPRRAPHHVDTATAADADESTHGRIVRQTRQRSHRPSHGEPKDDQPICSSSVTPPVRLLTPSPWTSPWL